LFSQVWTAIEATPCCRFTGGLGSASLVADFHSASSWTRSRVPVDSRRVSTPPLMR
jgi:hypothetical protein